MLIVLKVDCVPNENWRLHLSLSLPPSHSFMHTQTCTHCIIFATYTINNDDNINIVSLFPLRPPKTSIASNTQKDPWSLYKCILRHWYYIYKGCSTSAQTSVFYVLSASEDHADMIEWFFMVFPYFFHNFSPPIFSRMERRRKSMHTPLSAWLSSYYVASLLAWLSGCWQFPGAERNLWWWCAI